MLPQNVFLVSLVFAIHASVDGRWMYGSEGINQIGKNVIGVESNRRKDPMKPYSSTPEECDRTCRGGERPRNCHYRFALEYYTTMGKACELCKPNSTDRLANIAKCQCIEADGFERGMLSINRMLPGPSIRVCQNDTVIVDVTNHVQGMEAALHWHGMWQKGSQYYDGVPFLTQCPIPSGTTFRYKFVASNPGTHFYHSHVGLQKIDGQYGSLIVRQSPKDDPHTKLYDFDHSAHVILLSDWMHEMSIERFPGRFRNRTGQLPENVLINGRGRWNGSSPNRTTSEQLETFVVQKGKRFRFRMINSCSTVCPTEMTIQGHSLILITQDGEPVKPVPVNTIVSSSGERVDFILEANRVVNAYWIEVRAIGACADGDKKISQLAILRYEGGPEMPKTSRPNERGIVYNDLHANCAGSQSATAVCPNQLKSVSLSTPEEFLRTDPDHRIILPFRFFSYENLTEQLFKPGPPYSSYLVTTDRDHITSLVDGISFKFPGVPPLSQDIDSSETCNRNELPKDCTAPCHCPHTHHIKKDAIVEVVLYNTMSQTDLHHPFHLHGYAFYLFQIGRLIGRSNDSQSSMDSAIKQHREMLISKKYNRLAKKDTVVVPDGGYVILRFKADNPGWWLFHCHFLYHTAIGMDVVLHVGEKNDLPPVPAMFPKCHSHIPGI